MSLKDKVAKIKLITHKSDLDGMGCAILMKVYARLMNELNTNHKLEVDVDYCDYNNTLDTLKEFVENGIYKEYKALYLTDLALDKEEIVTYLDLLSAKDCLDYDLKLIDHHLDSYTKASNKEYALIDISGNRSAIEVLYDYLVTKDIQMPNTVKEFVKNVSSYDTWRWVKEENVWAEILNVNCFNRVKSEADITQYVDYMVNLLLDKNVLIEDEDRESIYSSIKERDELISRKLGDIYKYNIKGHLAGVVFVTDKEYKQRSLMGSKICEKNPDVSFAAIVNVDCDKMSFRSSKNDVNLNDLAKHFDGGGHPKAAGARVVNYDIVSSSEGFDKIRDNTHKGITPDNQDECVNGVLELIFG